MSLNRIISRIRQGFSRFWESRYRNYIIVTILFLLWITVFSPNTVVDQVRAYRELRELRRMKDFYQKEIAENEALIKKFKTDPDFVETYGRETYLMKKDNEDIFLFVEEPDSKLSFPHIFKKKPQKTN